MLEMWKDQNRIQASNIITRARVMISLFCPALFTFDFDLFISFLRLAFLDSGKQDLAKDKIMQARKQNLTKINS